MPKFSVIIPTRNRSALIAGAIDSARRAGEDVEIIVVDDASTDDTAAACRRFGGAKYIRLERRQGVAGARNVGLVASSGEYLAFLDDDDRRAPDSLTRQAAMLAERPGAGFACGAALYADQNYRLTGEAARPPCVAGQGPTDIFWDLLEIDFFALPLTVLVRREALLRAGMFRRHLERIDDWEWLVRLAELFPAVVHPEPVGVYRLPTPSSKQNTSHLAADFVRMMRCQTELFRLPRARAAGRAQRALIRRRTRDRLADTLFAQAAARLPEGAYRYAWENLTTGLRLSAARVVRPYVYRTLWRAGRAKIN